MATAAFEHLEDRAPMDLTIAVRSRSAVGFQDLVFEANETNNTAFAGNTLRVPVSLTLQLASAQISEEATVPVRVTLSRNGATEQPLVVAVSNSHPAELSFIQGTNTVATTNITISAGQSTVMFNLYVLRDSVPDGDQLVTITSSAPGYDAASVVVTVLNADLPTLTLRAEVDLVPEGFTAGGTVTRDVVTSAALTVALTSSRPNQLSPPDWVIIPAGAASASFTVLAVDDAYAESEATYSISAAVIGFNDNDVPTLAVSLSQHTVSEGAGAQALFMTLTRNPIDEHVLKTFGRLSSTKGSPSTAGKANASGTQDLSGAEHQWLEQAVRLLIRRLGGQAAGGSLTPIRMSDLPKL